MICSSILGVEKLESDLLQPGGTSQLHTFYYKGLSRDGEDAVFALRPDYYPGVESDHQTWCLDQRDTIESLTFERLCKIHTCELLGLEIKIGDMVNDYTPPDLLMEEPFESFAFSWRELFRRLLREEKIAMTLYSQWLSHLKGDTILKEDTSNVEGCIGPVEEQAKLWTEDQLAKPWPELARLAGQGMKPICRMIARRGRSQSKLNLKDNSGMVDYRKLLSEHKWYRCPMQDITESSSAMVDYHKILSEHRWYRNLKQRASKVPSNRLGVTSSVRWSGLSAASESETGLRTALPSHGSCCLSSRHAGQEKLRYVRQSETSEPSDTDDNLPDPRSLSNPVTPIKPSSSENRTIANAPKKSQKLTRKFSEADLEESTASKRPRLAAPPAIAARRPEIAPFEHAQSYYPLPSSLRHAHPANERKSNMTMQVEEDSRGRPYNRHNLQDSIEAGMKRIQITSSLTSENERIYTYNPQDFIETEMERMEMASSLASEDEKMHTYNPQDSSEADAEQTETTPSLGSEDEDMFGDDGFSS